MNHNKIIIISTISYVILYILVYYTVTHMKLTPSDAAGMGLASGFRTLLILAVFFIIALVLTVFNLFLFKGITNTGTKLLAFMPIVISVAHTFYTYRYG